MGISIDKNGPKEYLVRYDDSDSGVLAYHLIRCSVKEQLVSNPFKVKGLVAATQPIPLQEPFLKVWDMGPDGEDETYVFPGGIETKLYGYVIIKNYLSFQKQKLRILNNYLDLHKPYVFYIQNY